MISLALAPAVVAPGPVATEFVFIADSSARTVAVAGTFNEWNSQTSFLERDSDGRTWRLTLYLRPGRHLYKFVVNSRQWVVDPKASAQEEDGAGNVNSVLMVVPADYSAPAKRGDGVIARSTMEHIPGHAMAGVYRGQLRLKFRLRNGDADHVEAVVNGRRVPMTVSAQDEWTETRTARLPFRAGQSLDYWFRVRDGRESVSFGANGAGGSAPFRLSGAQMKAMEVPAWAPGTVFYQIFADRFENGSKANDPQGVADWGAKPEYYNWFGGDAAGVKKRIPHLKQLGVEAIYFNPLFAGPSNHRYETTDYRKIDPRFGSNEEFFAMSAALRKAGIRTILDGVFNHTSVDFAAFKSLREQGEASPYRGWYTVKSFPVQVKNPPNYLAWAGYESMPKVNLDYPAARSYMLDAADFWNKSGAIDGWRLDVAGEVSMDFWRAFRARVRQADPNLWIVGEVWSDGSPWLGGDQWDSIMGYQFRGVALDLLARKSINGSQAIDRLLAVYESYAPQVSQNLMNLLGSHDTPRFLNEVNGDRCSAKLGATLLLTWPGSPSIYYGDELGMEGGQDPDNRRGMRWDMAGPANEIFAHYRRLISLRKSVPALRTGDPIKVDAGPNVAAFGRVEGGSRALVFINPTQDTQSVDSALPADWNSWSMLTLRDALANARVARPARGRVRLTLAPQSSAILLPQ